MSKRVVRGLIILTAASRLFAQSEIVPRDSAEPQRLLARITDIALRTQSQLPDFISTQTTTRAEHDSGKGVKFKKRDTIETEFTFVTRKPTWKLIKFNGKPTHIVDVRTGFRSDGILQFFLLPGSLFGPKVDTAFAFVRWDTLKNRRVGVFSLRVEQYNSQLAFTGTDGRLVVGFHGLLFADADSAEVVRLEIDTDLPTAFAIASSKVEVDYSGVNIGDQSFFLPARAQVEARISGKLYKNETEIVKYQKYGAESKLSFGDN